MKRNKYIKISFALGVMILSMAMFGDKSQTSLESMGFPRAKTDDIGLIEMAVDQLRTSIKTRNMAQLKALLSSDLQNSVSKGENTQQSLNFSKENVTLGAKSSHFLPTIELRTTKIALQNKRAVVYGNIEAGSESTPTMELTFAKENDMWKLVSDNELLSNLEAELRKMTSDADTEQSVTALYTDNGAENRTIVLRAMSDEHNIQKLTKSVTQSKHAPFFRAQYVQLVTDPAWNRVVYGDYDGWVKAYKNGTSEGEALKSPHGIDRDANGNIYIADTGNSGIVVLKLVGSEGETELSYQFSFGKGDLSLPYDVAWDDSLQNSDDLIWVTDTGNHRILGYSLNEKSAEQKFSYGSKILKETTDFYLPLYYHEDSGADKKQDAHLVQGTAYSEWGNAPFETIARHPSEVIYRFTNLNPSVEYEFKADFFNKVGYDLKQSIHVDQTQVSQEAEVPAGFRTVDWLALPRETFSDGSVEISFKKEAGEGDAMVSQLWLREANNDAENSPEQQTISASIPEKYTLGQNYPNPFNPTTNIEFGVPEGIVNNVTLRIYNTLGQTVHVLMNGQLPPGRHTIEWNGRDSLNRPVSSGLYFYQLKAGKHSEVKKMILMK